MELILGLAVIVVVAALLIINASKGKDGINTVGETLTDALDVNKDGKVDAEDAKVVVEKAKTAVKKATTKAKTAVKKTTTRGRKPKAQ